MQPPEDDPFRPPWVGKAVASDLGTAHNLAVAPLFDNHAGCPIPMSYYAHGSSRDVWAGHGFVLKVRDLRREARNIAEFEALRTFADRLRVPQPLWLGKASIHQVVRSCLLVTSGGTDAVAALSACLRSEGDPWLVAEWAIAFLVQGIDFLVGAVEQGVFPGRDWT